MDYTRVLKQPIITEKSTILKEENNQVVFKVDRSANKIEIKKAVQEAFNVNVEKVNVVNKRTRKKKRLGREIGKETGYKKAYIKLSPGDKIEYFEGV